MKLRIICSCSFSQEHDDLLPKIRNERQGAVVHGGFVGADAGGGPVGGREDVDGGRAFFDDAAGEFVDEMRMGAVMAAGDFERRRRIQIVVIARFREGGRSPSAASSLCREL